MKTMKDLNEIVKDLPRNIEIPEDVFLKFNEMLISCIFQAQKKVRRKTQKLAYEDITTIQRLAKMLSEAKI